MLRLLACASLLSLGACQLYRPSPLEPEAHLESWHQRSAKDESVRDFAKRINERNSKSVRLNPADGLTLAEAELLALIYNPDLRLSRLRAKVTEASAKHAGRWDDPRLGIDVLKVQDSIPDPWILGSSLSLTIPLSGRLAVEKSRAAAEHHAELAKVAEDEWKAILELRQAWLAWSANSLRLEETERMVESLETIVESTTKLAEGGELPRTEAKLFRIELQSRKAELAKLRGQVREDEQQIRSILGLSPRAMLGLRPTLHSSTSKADGKLTEANAKLIRLQQEYEVAELKLRREIRKQYPDIELGPIVEEEEGQSRIGGIGMIPIPLLNSNKGGIATAKAERELARAAFETELERTTGRLAALNERLNGSRNHRHSLESDLVPLVDEQVKDARRLLELGEGGSLVLLESLVRAHEAKLHLIEARLDESRTQNEIHHLHGPAPWVAKTK
ncbi:MAG: TolC family protein [Akkermansiaceae bacterium]|nr:TolC family protein [Akkermansiaceae bacterium]